MRAVERARSDIEAGRLWKARDRLQGAVVSRPHDQELLNLLGEVAFRMGDLPTAGRYWFLTERQDAEAEKALTAMRERYGPGAVGISRALPFRPFLLADNSFLGTFPPSVAARLETVASELRSVQPRFGERADSFRWRTRRKLLPAWLSSFLGAVVLITFIGIWIFGLVSALRAIF